MSKLNPELASKVAKAEVTRHAPVESGIYAAKLLNVQPGKSKASGNPMWVWEFELPGTSAWTVKEYTVLQENSFWKLKQVFDAFGVTPDTDTDDLVGRTVYAYVEKEQYGEDTATGLPRYQNKIAYYPDQSDAAGVAQNENPAPVTPPKDDDLPF